MALSSELHSSSEIEQSSPDARKLARSAAGPPHPGLRWRWRELL
jgi:hypothetical protein